MTSRAGAVVAKLRLVQMERVDAVVGELGFSPGSAMSLTYIVPVAAVAAVGGTGYGHRWAARSHRERGLGDKVRRTRLVSIAVAVVAGGGSDAAFAEVDPGAGAGVQHDEASVSLDPEQVPVVALCMDDGYVQRASDRWQCALPSPPETRPAWTTLARPGCAGGAIVRAGGPAHWICDAEADTRRSEAQVDAMAADDGHASSAGLSRHAASGSNAHRIADARRLVTVASGLDASRVRVGALTADHYSAHADLRAESRLGDASHQTTAGAHEHDDRHGTVADVTTAVAAATTTTSAELQVARGAQSDLASRIAALESALESARQTSTSLRARLNAFGIDDKGCPDSDPTDGVREMVRVGSTCVDTYEMSLEPGVRFDPATDQKDADASCVWGPAPPTCTGQRNGEQVTGIARSRPAANVLHSTSWLQAAALCGNAGKRLCQTPAWVIAAVGTPDDTGQGTLDPCNLNPGSIPAGALPDNSGSDGSTMRHQTGTAVDCRSARASYDLVGNTAEWTEGWEAEPGWNGTTSRW